MRRDSTRAVWLHAAFSVALATATGLAFWVPALIATHGEWPAPLDDVFIHFDFARAAAEGHPMSWISGQQYASGETSPLYALVLAVGYAAGFRGYFIGIWAAIVAIGSLTVAMHALREWTAPGPAWVAWITAPMLVCVGVVDASLYSGMEVALFVALLARALIAAKRTQLAAPTDRGRAQWMLGACGALMVTTRPEAVVIVGCLAVVAARGARSHSPAAALARAGLPGALATLAVLGMNWMMTGDPQSAGARLKLLSSNPFLSDIDRARELVLNLFYFSWRLCADQLAASPSLVWVLPATALVSLASRRSRDLGAAALASCVLYTILVSFNGAARYQNFRYYVPAIALLLFAATLGVGTLARSRLRRAAPLLAAFAAIGAASRAGGQIDLFARSSANIHDQQVATGRRLRASTPQNAIVLVGDAGAIPYFSGRATIDALGLGGYYRLPLARAAPHGEAATVELLQRLDPSMRPTHMALYPNWFPQITGAFGREISRVTLTDNVICGGPVKVIYAADFSPLDGDTAPVGELLDELDIADVLSERAHDYESPAPAGGFTTLAIRERIFDGGRIIPEGERERFVLRPVDTAAVLVIRTDDASGIATLIVGKTRVIVTPSATRSGAWIALRAEVPPRTHAFTIEATRGPLRDFHLWLIKAP